MSLQIKKKNDKAKFFNKIYEWVDGIVRLWMFLRSLKHVWIMTKVFKVFVVEIRSFPNQLLTRWGCCGGACFLRLCAGSRVRTEHHEHE